MVKIGAKKRQKYNKENSLFRKRTPEIGYKPPEKVLKNLLYYFFTFIF